MRIAVVAHALRTAGGLGVGKGLIASMIEVAPQNEYLFIVPDNVGYEEICWRAPASLVHPTEPQDPLERLRFDKIQLVEMIESFRPDVVFALDSSHALPTSRWPQAIFVHDAHLFYPSRHFGPMTLRDRTRHVYLKWHFGRSLRSAQVIFAQTQVVGRRIQQQYGYKGRISVCGFVAPPVVQSSQTQLPVPSEFRPHASRFKCFCPARYYPHKNIERIVDVFRRYSQDLSDVRVFLTLETNQHPNVAPILRLIEKADIGDLVINIGELPYEVISAYYAHSDALLMPSFLEALGTPYLEAMELGLPIITSDLDFAHEACGGAALYLDPWDARSIKDAILRLAGDEGLRAELTRAAQERTQILHSWNDVAIEIVNGLQAIADKP